MHGPAAKGGFQPSILDPQITVHSGGDPMAADDITAIGRFFETDRDDAKSRQHVADLVAARGRAALDALYERIASNPHTRGFFPDDAATDRAKNAQLRHWLALFRDGISPDYQASAERIGQTHARIGLDPAWYIGGYPRRTARASRTPAW
jgi:methyl-accepting chemotaxis protein